MSFRPVPQYEVADTTEGNPAGATCGHLVAVSDVTPSSTNGCEDCLGEGTGWVHLRECLECGHVGCCDNSPRRHATAHFNATRHPVMRSFEAGEDWAWCYPDSLLLVPA